MVGSYLVTSARKSFSSNLLMTKFSLTVRFTPEDFGVIYKPKKKPQCQLLTEAEGRRL